MTPARRRQRRRVAAAEKESWTTRLTSVQRIAAALGTVLGVLVAVTTLTDWVINRGSDEPRASIDARLLEVRRQSVAQTLAEYVRETRPKSVPRYTAEQLREVGYIFDVRLSIEGRVKQRLPLRWAMHDAATGRPLPEKRVYSQVAATFVPEATKHTRTWPVWVPFPPERGRYFVRFVLVGIDGRPEDDRESAAFRYEPQAADDA
jgi:hypothetical protein